MGIRSWRRATVCVCVCHMESASRSLHLFILIVNGKWRACPTLINNECTSSTTVIRCALCPFPFKFSMSCGCLCGAPINYLPFCPFYLLELVWCSMLSLPRTRERIVVAYGQYAQCAWTVQHNCRRSHFVIVYIYTWCALCARRFFVSFHKIEMNMTFVATIWHFIS